MPAKKYALWAVTAFAVVYLVKSPAAAATAVNNAANGIASVAGSLSIFLNKLAA